MSISYPLPDPIEGSPRGTIEQLRRENAALRETIRKLRSFRVLAYRDPLTGLRNRRFFDERLAEEISRANRAQGSTFSLILIDLNDFKMVNDIYGHLVGDDTLKRVARFIAENLRQHEVLCRIGGDEFVILLPNAGSHGCSTVISRLRARLEHDNVERTIRIGLSIGYACWPDHATTVEGLLSAADASMYADKARQKGPIDPAVLLREIDVPAEESVDAPAEAVASDANVDIAVSTTTVAPEEPVPDEPVATHDPSATDLATANGSGAVE